MLTTAVSAADSGELSLLAVDAGSNQISVLRVTARGAPERVGRPVPSGGVQPVSIAINRSGLVYVANVGDGGSNYAGFLFTRGRLIPLPHSTVPVPEGSGVGDVLFNSTGDRLIGTRDNPSLIDSFTVRRDGRLAAAPGSPFPAFWSTSGAGAPAGNSRSMMSLPPASVRRPRCCTDRNTRSGLVRQTTPARTPRDSR